MDTRLDRRAAKRTSPPAGLKRLASPTYRRILNHECFRQEKDVDDSTTHHQAVQASSRVVSVDVLRGLTILTMVFVNDVGPAAPSWTHHIQPPDADGMTLADIVFPTFLFLVGVSIPLAIQRAKQRGDSLIRQFGHIISRTVALILMGLVQYNYAADQTLGKYWWGLLAYIAIILTWCIVPKEAGLRRNALLVLKIIGIVGLLALFAAFRREATTANLAFYGPTENWVWLQTGWWGILGLIGWAYLVAALVYLLVGNRREWLIGAMALLYCLFMADRSGGLFAHLDTKNWLGPMLPVIGFIKQGLENVDQFVDLGGILGSQAAISIGGCLLGTVLLQGSDIATHAQRLRWASAYAALLFVAGCMTDFFAGINKIAATPTWCLWSSAVAVVVWIFAYSVIDIWGHKKWAIAVQPAGANPLIAYLLHPIIIWIVAITGFSTSVMAYKSSDSAGIAMLGSLVMAFVVCALTGLIARAGLRVRI